MAVTSQVGVPQAGKISWFGGPGDPTSGPTTSSGAPVSYPGISTYNQATKGGYWLVKMPNGKAAVLKQTDIGPAPWTGRNFDFTYTALGHLGYSTGNFPTDATIHATYLGKQVPGQYSHLVIGAGGNAASLPTGPGAAPATQGGVTALKQMSNRTVSKTTQGFDQLGYQAAKANAIAGQYLKSQSKDPYAVGAPKTGLSTSNPLISSGVLSTTTPNPADYVTTHTQLQKIAGTSLAQHPAVAGTAITRQAVKDATTAGASPAAQKLLRMVHMVNGAAYSQANHDAINQGAGSIKARGTDCSGFVSWLMGPQGLGIWHTSLATPDIANAPGMQAGKGNVITVYNNRQSGNAGHVFIQVGNQFWASEGGVGIHQLPMSEVQNYIQHGSDGGTYVALHPKGL